MKRSRWHLWLIAFALGLAALMWSSTAAAAPDNGPLLDHASNTVIVDSPVQPTFAIPGIFSLSLGQGFSQEGDNIKLDTAEVDLPALNATATVNGLTFGFTKGISGWDSITVAQSQPGGNQAVTVSGAQVSVQGPTANYSTAASARIDVHPNAAVQAGATFAASYDGLARTLGFTIHDGDAMMQAGPVKFVVTGLNNEPATFTIATAEMDVPAIGATATLNGYKLENGRANWDALNIAQNPDAALRAGNFATVSEIKVEIKDSSASYATTAGAHFELNAGQTAHTQGQLLIIANPAGQQSGVALANGSATLQVAGWNLELAGINSINGGAKIDTMTLTAQPINLEVVMTGVVLGGSAGFAFDQAKITYLPGQNAQDVSAAGGFQMTITRNGDAGYVLTTTTMIPAGPAH